MTFLLSDGNYLFTGALMLMLVLALLEGALSVLGAGMSQVIDGILPDVNIGVDGELPDGGISRLLSWIRVGRVPFIMLLVIFLTAFGLAGLAMQSLLAHLVNWLLPAWLAWLPVMFVALPVTRFGAGLLSRCLLKDETQAISGQDFIGHVAQITVGEARRGSPAEARFRDQYGTTHYLMVEPDSDETFVQGDSLLLVSQQGSSYLGIRPANSHLQ